MNALVIEIFKKTNRDIARSYPPLESMVIEQEKNISSAKLFMRVVNCLHDQAKRLDCDIQVPAQIDKLQRMTWELEHLQELAATVGEKTKTIKAKDFATFIVALILQFVNLEEIPDEENSNFHQKIWEFLIQNKKEQIENLENFYLNKGIYFLPPEIQHFTSLKILRLSSNKLINLPVEIGKLTKLKELDVRFNQLKTLPLELNQLVQLEILDVSNNQIEHLPSEIGKLISLRNLYVDNNPLKELPADMINLSKLRYIAVNDLALDSSPDVKNFLIKKGVSINK